MLNVGALAIKATWRISQKVSLVATSPRAHATNIDFPYKRI